MKIIPKFQNSGKLTTKEQNKRKQLFLNLNGIKVKIDGSWGPWQEKQYRRLTTKNKHYNTTPLGFLSHLYDKTLGGYVNPLSTEAAAGKLALQLVDPTGISSYPDVYYSFNKLIDLPSWGNLGNFTFNVVGALPLLGKVSAPFKAAKTIKLLNRVGKAGSIVKNGERIHRVNRAIDTFPELIPGVRKAAEKTLDFTTMYITNPIFMRYASPNKLEKIKLFRNTNTAINYINASNTGADLTLGISDISSNWN